MSGSRRNARKRVRNASQSSLEAVDGALRSSKRLRGKKRINYNDSDQDGLFVLTANETDAQKKNKKAPKKKKKTPKKKSAAKKKQSDSYPASKPFTPSLQLKSCKFRTTDIRTGLLKAGDILSFVSDNKDYDATVIKKQYTPIQDVGIRDTKKQIVKVKGYIIMAWSGSRFKTDNNPNGEMQQKWYIDTDGYLRGCGYLAYSPKYKTTKQEIELNDMDDPNNCMSQSVDADLTNSKIAINPNSLKHQEWIKNMEINITTINRRSNNIKTLKTAHEHFMVLQQYKNPESIISTDKLKEINEDIKIWMNDIKEDIKLTNRDKNCNNNNNKIIIPTKNESAKNNDIINDIDIDKDNNNDNKLLNDETEKKVPKALKPGYVQCKFCGLYYAKTGLQQHIVTMHQDELQHKCDECGQLFATIPTLKSHQRTLHYKRIILPTLCPRKQCGASLTKGRLYKMKIKDGEFVSNGSWKKYKVDAYIQEKEEEENTWCFTVRCCRCSYRAKWNGDDNKAYGQ